MWMRFYTQGKFSWRKKIFVHRNGGGRGEIIVNNAAMNTPNPSWSYSFPAAVLSHFFTSTSNINYFFIIFYARTLFQTIF